MIEFKNIYKYFDNNIRVLNNLNLIIKEEEIFVLAGEQGSGKTTILKMINRLIKPSSGEILISSRNIAEFDKAEFREKVSYISSDSGLFPHLTVAQNIGIPLCLDDVEKEDRDKRTIDVLKLVGLKYEDYEKKYPEELSDNDKQKVGFARALTPDPDIILMDEPYLMLDVDSKKRFSWDLLNMQDMIKKTIVFATDDIDEAIKIGDRIGIIKEGEIIQCGSPQEILKHPNNEYVEYYVGKNRLLKSADMLYAKDIMNKQVATINPARNSAQATQIMRSCSTNVLIVVENYDESENPHFSPIGIIGPKQIKKALNYDANIGEIMRRDIRTVKEDTPLNDVLELREKFHQYNIPVLDNDMGLKGIITERSILNVLTAQSPDIEEVR